MSISLAGVIGAAIGLYVGWLDYRILKGMLQAAETKKTDRRAATVAPPRNTRRC
ncbi:hypothetical protein QW131_10590 [Roseibium salinum]|nr:hypothetical protein [Roseibium salinum]